MMAGTIMVPAGLGYALIWQPALTGIHLFDFGVMGHQFEFARDLRRFEVIKAAAQTGF
jgi:hypothetical protein